MKIAESFNHAKANLGKANFPQIYPVSARWQRQIFPVMLGAEPKDGNIDTIDPVQTMLSFAEMERSRLGIKEISVEVFDRLNKDMYFRCTFSPSIINCIKSGDLGFRRIGALPTASSLLASFEDPSRPMEYFTKGLVDTNDRGNIELAFKHTLLGFILNNFRLKLPGSAYREFLGQNPCFKAIDDAIIVHFENESQVLAAYALQFKGWLNNNSLVEVVSFEEGVLLPLLVVVMENHPEISCKEFIS